MLHYIVEVFPAKGAFYAFVRVAGDDMEVASRWLDAGHVAATPGSAFLCTGVDPAVVRGFDGEAQRGDGED